MENLKKFCKEKSIDFFFPVAFILGIIPLIVRVALIKLDHTSFSIWGASEITDLFSQEKSFYLIIFSIILIVISLISFKTIFTKKDKTVNIIVIASIVFLAFTLLSTIFSEYKQVSLWGVYDRAEGFITILCYIVLFIYSIYTFKNTENFKYIIIPIVILVFINSFLGIFQYIGEDLLKTNVGKAIVIPGKYENYIRDISLLYEKGKLYGTLFHYNYVGSFVAIVLPILLGYFIVEDYYIGRKLMAGLAFLGSLWLLFGSTSRAGIMGVFASTIFAIIIFWKKLVPKWKPILIFFISIFVIVIGINFASKGAIFQRIPSLLSDSLSIFKNTNDFDYKEHVPVKDIIHTSEGTVEVVLPNDSLKISYENNDFIFKNSKDKIIQYTQNNNLLKTTVKPFTSISFKIGAISSSSAKKDALLLNINEQSMFLFKLKEDNSLHLTNMNTGEDMDLEYPETFGFKGKEKLGSARGYIWSRSIPLLKNTLLLGYGPDTFVYKFPKNDFIGKYYAYDTPNMLVDKPHNLYLQIALNQGLIALLAFITVIMVYIVDSVKLYALKNEYNKPSVVYGCITFLGVIGYVFAGLFNDSVISVAPVFWIVFGVGVALNYINRNELDKKKA